jgi:hypothetical protein
VADKGFNIKLKHVTIDISSEVFTSLNNSIEQISKDPRLKPIKLQAKVDEKSMSGIQTQVEKTTESFKTQSSQIDKTNQQYDKLKKHKTSI